MNRAIAVREKLGRLVALLTEKQIKVTQRGAKAFVLYDRGGRPVTVNVPYIPDDAADDFLDAIEGFLDHEVAHILFTDYKALEAAAKMGVKLLHNIIEDAFIEKKMAEHFAGSGLNLRNVGEFFLRTYTDVKIREEGADVEGYLVVPMIRALSGQSVYQDYMKDKWALVARWMKVMGEYATEALPKIKSSADGLAVAIRIKELMELLPEADEPGEGEGKGKGKGKGKGQGKGKGKGDKSKPAKTPPEPAEEPEDDEGSEPVPEDDEGVGEDDFAPPEASGDEEAGDEGAGSAAPGKGDEDKDEEEGEGGATGTPGDDEGGSDPTSGESAPSAEEDAPTWKDFEEGMGDFSEKVAEALTATAVEEMRDAEYRVYSTDFDKIEPLVVRGDADRYVKSLQDSVDHMVAPLQKDLERAVAARSASVFSAGHRSGRLHAAALTRLTMFGDERAFRRKHESTSKDVAVSLLIDLSGSMQRENKVMVATQAAYALASVLDRMNITNEVLGFTTAGGMPSEMHEEGIRYARHERLYIPIIKAFSERLNIEVKKRFSVLPHEVSLRENVDGESVQIAATRILQRKEQRKILIVLSDGQPACPGDSESLRRHLKKTVAQVEKMGVEVLAIGILSSAPESFYTRSVVLNKLEELPNTVIGQIKKLLMK